MIELAVIPAADNEMYWGMPLPALLALFSLVSVVLGAVATGLVKKFRTPADTREDRVVVLDASDRLIQRFEKLLADSDSKHQKEIAELTEKFDNLEAEVRQMRDERSGLMGALRAVIRIAKHYGGQAAETEIDRVGIPPGVLSH